jgi:hypothetical protein
MGSRHACVNKRKAYKSGCTSEECASYLLGRAVWGCETAGSAVLIYSRAPHNGQRRGSFLCCHFPIRPGSATQHDGVEALAAAVPVAESVERLATAHRRQRLFRSKCSVVYSGAFDWLGSQCLFQNICIALLSGALNSWKASVCSGANAGDLLVIEASFVARQKQVTSSFPALKRCSAAHIIPLDIRKQSYCGVSSGVVFLVNSLHAVNTSRAAQETMELTH